MKPGSGFLCPVFVVSHDFDEVSPYGWFRATVHQFLLNSAKLWKFGKDYATTQSNGQVGDSAEGGVRGNARKPVGCPALHA